MSAPRSVWLKNNEIAHRQKLYEGSDARLYHLIPADPDGPMPGETWMCDGWRVKVLGPRLLNADGTVRSWWVATGSAATAADVFAENLTRIPEPPEHEEWCAYGKEYPCCVVNRCTCERRKGERRDGVQFRLSHPDGTMYGRHGGGWWFGERVSDRRASDTAEGDPAP